MTSQQIKILAVVVALGALAVIVPNTNSFLILLATRALAFAIAKAFRATLCASIGLILDDDANPQDPS